MSVRNYDEILKELEEKYQPQKDADINASDQMYDTQKQTVSDSYNAQIQEAKSAYQNRIDENAVQRIINERQIAENMANLGLTDSGLNRTQQTATQLSYANNNTKINLARQKAVDSLAQAMTAKMAELDAGKLAAAEGIRSNYAQEARNQAVNVYNNEVTNETARQKAAYEAEVKKYEANLKAQTEALKRNQTNFTTLLRDISSANLTDAQKLASLNAYFPDNPDELNEDMFALLTAYGYGYKDGKITKVDTSTGEGLETGGVGLDSRMSRYFGIANDAVSSGMTPGDAQMTALKNAFNAGGMESYWNTRKTFADQGFSTAEMDMLMEDTYGALWQVVASQYSKYANANKRNLVNIINTGGAHWGKLNDDTKLDINGIEKTITELYNEGKKQGMSRKALLSILDIYGVDGGEDKAKERANKLA